jgi:hypothetical protein
MRAIQLIWLLGLICAHALSAELRADEVSEYFSGAENDSQPAEQSILADPEAPPIDSQSLTSSGFLTGPQAAAAPNPFANTPPIFNFPRLGFYPVAPTGPGYYSARDHLTGEYRQKPPPFPWGRISLKPFPFYDADFRYLDDPKNTYLMWSDILKRRQIGDEWLFSSGGEFRDRYMNEIDSRLTETVNQYEQLRTIVYGSLYHGEDVGFFIQYLDAQHLGNELAPLPIDRNRSDLVDLYVDLKLLEWDDRPVYLRGGRQELCLGSQRLVSNLEWANTLRTFQGVRAFRQGEKWDVSAFWLQPIIPNPTYFDSPDERQNFTGVWATYRPKAGRFWDLYVLNLDNSNRVFAGEGGVLGGENVTTLGTRIVGDIENTWLFDIEEMLQVGRHSNQQLQAAASTTGIGYNFKDVDTTPQIWAYYDFASGDAQPGVGGQFGTFNQLYPFGHYYLGYLDLVARQNIQDFNLQLVFFPTKWIYVLTQYHNFHLAQARSPLFGAGGGPIRVDPTGAAGTDVGDELDIMVNFHLTAHQDILIGFSKLFPGRFIRETGPNVSPELFYLQHQVRW